MTHDPVFPPIPVVRPVWTVFSFMVGFFVASFLWDFCNLIQGASPNPDQPSLYTLEKQTLIPDYFKDRQEFVVTIDPLNAFERWALWAERHQYPR